MTITAFVSWPSAPLTDSLVLKALSSLDSSIQITRISPEIFDGPLLQWSTYDAIDHERTLSHEDNVLSSSYIVRKALIRKHFLHRSIQAYATKSPKTILHHSIPMTWDIELAFADELDELWNDELLELDQELQRTDKRWYILKPGMSDRGMGIRLFNNKERLREIFESFEDLSDDEDEESNSTNVILTQLRHFVIQEYLGSPLLLDPYEVPVSQTKSNQTSQVRGYKFHLRAYCIAAGALTVYMCPNILALFSSEPYCDPSEQADPNDNLSMRSHLTNTSLQQERGEEGVRLLTELTACRIMNSGLSGEQCDVLDENDVQTIVSQMVEITGETFRAAVQMPVHFLPLSNAFELFGVDFLVTYSPSTSQPKSNRLQVSLLEFNAEPAIELTGPRLQWILEDLFASAAKVCVQPFFVSQPEQSSSWGPGEVRHGLIKCAQIQVRGP